MSIHVHRHVAPGVCSRSVVEFTERSTARFRLLEGARELDELARTADPATAKRLRYAERAEAMRASAERL